VRFAAETAVAYLWAELFNSAVPQEEVYGINFRHLLLLIPAVIALGKNIKKKKAPILTMCIFLIARLLVRFPRTTIF